MNTSILLVCSVLASLAAGVLLAYGVCQMVFSMFRMHARRVPAESEPASVVSAVVAES